MSMREYNLKFASLARYAPIIVYTMHAGVRQFMLVLGMLYRGIFYYILEYGHVYL